MISLPPQDDPIGLTIRLLIAESLTPSSSAYVEADVIGGMQEMWSTIANRLTSPRDFCAAGATDAIGIITAVCPGGGHQFAGFAWQDGQTVIDSGIASRIDACLSQANNGSDDYATFVNGAITVATSAPTTRFGGLNEINGIAVKPGPYGWRTAGHGGPGGRFIAIPSELGGVIAGNQFFTLRA